jgi:pyrroloquinoline quinone biosynthesis protein D
MSIDLTDLSAQSPPNLEACLKVAAFFRLQWEAAQNAWVLLYPEGMVKLNGSAGEILRRLDGEKTVQAVVDDIEKTFSRTDLKTDVLNFLAIASQNGWIALSGPKS